MAVWLAGLIPTASGAESPPPDKSGYTLFHPTPPELMRELSADRPDKTDSPYTVDAGHFQLEMDAANFSRSEHQDIRTTQVQAVVSNFKIGVLNRLDLQCIIEPYTYQRTEDLATQTVDERSGWGDVTPRFKVNLWGNDGGRTALGMLPFVKIPTSSGGLGNNSVEGGVKFPFAVEVPGWDVSAMTEFDTMRDSTGSGHHAEFVNSASVGHPIYGQLSLYAEFYSLVSAEPGADWVGTVDVWLTYQVTANLRLDGGVYVGVTPAADDVQAFVGCTWRY